MFNIAVTLTYGQGHWKWSEQVKLNKSNHHATYDVCHIYGVWDNPKVKVFDKPRHLTDQESKAHLSHKNHSVHNLFNVCSRQ